MTDRVDMGSITVLGHDCCMATINCPYCNVRSHMTPLHGFSTSRDSSIFSAVFRCDHCYRLCVATSPYHGRHSHSSDAIKAYVDSEEVEKTWEPKTVLGKEFPDIPSHISAPASEAFMCFSIGAYRAAVLLARAVIEASAKEKGVTTGSLYEKIDKLAEQMHVRSMLADAAHEVRLAGNDMAHGDFATAEIPEEDAEELLGFMEDFLRELFELPTRVQRRKNRRSATE